MHGLKRGGSSLSAQFCGADRHRLEHLAACGDKHVYRDPRESLLCVDWIAASVRSLLLVTYLELEIYWIYVVNSCCLHLFFVLWIEYLDLTGNIYLELRRY